MQEQKLLSGIKEAENTQSVAELTQKISRLQMKVKKSFTSVDSNYNFN